MIIRIVLPILAILHTSKAWTSSCRVHSNSWRTRCCKPSFAARKPLALQASASADGTSSTSTSTRRTELERNNTNKDTNTNTNNNWNDQNIDLLPGMPEGFFITKQFTTPSAFNISQLLLMTDTNSNTNTNTNNNNNAANNSNSSASTTGTLQNRLQLSPYNVTLPVALLLLDPKEYPSLSKARKACRKSTILLQHSIIKKGDDDDDDDVDVATTTTTIIGRVGDRVVLMIPGTTTTTTTISSTVICKQERLSHGSYSSFISPKEEQRPSFDLPIVYEDDYLAIVNKPAGILVYAEANRGGTNTIKNALPYFVKPPATIIIENDDSSSSSSSSILDPLKRPELCHRLDKPTSGLLIVAKTKTAVVEMSRQFENRLVKKTYTAILNGKLEPPCLEQQTPLSAQQVHDLGFDVDLTSKATTTTSTSAATATTAILNNYLTDDDDRCWYLAESMLDDKVAITAWRVLRYQPSPNAANQTLTLVELKPKTGRYHQLRRQMAWEYNCPIVGDTTYGAGESALDSNNNKRWGRGLMLCSNRVVFEHPCSNRTCSSIITDADADADADESSSASKNMICASIDLPPKFESFLRAEGNKWKYYSSSSTATATTSTSTST